MSEATNCMLCARHEDKSEWPEGPWKNENNHVLFEHAGMPCIIHRGGGGNWCGYVAVPPGHPYHGLHYDDVYRKECEDGVPDANRLNVHGGITYTEHCAGHICHVPKPGEPDDVWWLGFDCGHFGDVCPWFDHRMAKHADEIKAIKNLNELSDALLGFESRYRDEEHYWTEEEAENETRRLAEQLATIGSLYSPNGEAVAPAV